ncbi:tripartite tricarboxylate transporter TctB family protein [Pseudoruegeria sp. HB172150]|uniref:tripartite tricarboxylate transporter TctB family protein n=1 Tax=Pseudoruegeria sp. HB172150 TaxID=2721164 RepID=UPI001553E6CB|nr:tripartite tricarboxylate transporter TctB family protein [Pseudoruegeria sp. HB172150]
MKRSDIISGTLIVLVGLLMIFVVVPRQIKSFSGYGLDPAFFPLSLLWLLVALGALLVATRLLKPVDPEAEGGGLDGSNWAYIGTAAMYFVLGFLAITAVGFVIAGAGMMIVLMLAIEKREARWTEVVLFPVATAFVIYWLLYNVFSVQLPSGPF